MNSSADNSTTNEPPAWWLRLARAAGVDQAVGFAVLVRIWQLLTGPATQLMVVWAFSTSRQDHYVTFNNLMGMQIFVELGLQVVLISFASHEWAKLSFRDGRVEGDATARSRLFSLGHMMLRWYSVLALIFVVAIMISGILFFDRTTELREAESIAREPVAWLLPWIALVLVNGLQLPLIPITAILEGCHQLRVINRVRFWTAVVGTFVVWTSILLGFGLWALVASACIRLFGELYLVLGPYGKFSAMFVTRQDGPRIDWRSEILPLQWRIAVQGVLLWGVNQMPGLVLFRYHEEGEATKLGMTWTVLTALQAAALAWIETRRPKFGGLIAAEEFEELDRQFFRLSRLSMSAMAVASVSFCIIVWWMGTRSEWLFQRLAGRMLGPDATMMLAAAMIVYQFALCTNLYVRAHKRDPFLLASIVSSLTIATLEVVLGRRHGGYGVALGYLIGISLVQVPLWTIIWWWTRRVWHQPRNVGGSADATN